MRRIPSSNIGSAQTSIALTGEVVESERASAVKKILGKDPEF